MRVQRIIWAISGAGLLVFLASSAWLAKLDERGPVGADVMLDGGLSASLYLPGAQPTSRARVAPRFGEPRPPGVVLMHGFSMDRRSMGGLPPKRYAKPMSRFGAPCSNRRQLPITH